MLGGRCSTRALFLEYAGASFRIRKVNRGCFMADGIHSEGGPTPAGSPFNDHIAPELKLLRAGYNPLALNRLTLLLIGDIPISQLPLFELQDIRDALLGYSSNLVKRRTHIPPGHTVPAHVADSDYVQTCTLLGHVHSALNAALDGAGGLDDLLPPPGTRSGSPEEDS
jgi:hypothetical protein